MHRRRPVHNRRSWLWCHLTDATSSQPLPPCNGVQSISVPSFRNLHQDFGLSFLHTGVPVLPVSSFTLLAETNKWNFPAHILALLSIENFSAPKHRPGRWPGSCPFFLGAGRSSAYWPVQSDGLKVNCLLLTPPKLRRRMPLIRDLAVRQSNGRMLRGFGGRVIRALF